jgi:hypothetical protein
MRRPTAHGYGRAMPNLVALALSSFDFAIGLTALTCALAELQPKAWRHRIPQRPLIAAAAALTAAAALVALVSPLAGMAVAGVALAAVGAAIHQHRTAGQDGGDDGRDDGGGPGPEPPAPSPGGIDWTAFERDFWDHVDGLSSVGGPRR